MGNAVPEQAFTFLMNFPLLESANARLVLALGVAKDVNCN